MPELGHAVQPIVPSFETVDELRVGLEAKANFDPVNLYPRDGSEKLGQVERQIAHFAGVNERELLVYTSGMSAVTDAVDIALGEAEAVKPVIAIAQETYTQTKNFIECFIRGKRADVYYFDSNDNGSIERVVTSKLPDVVIAESVANFVNVPVLDIDFLRQALSQQNKKSTLILDHTLPLSTGFPVGETISEDEDIIVVESGTKSYTMNAALLGIAYSKNPRLLDQLRRYRRTRGTLPSDETLQKTIEVLPSSQGEFDARNVGLFASTGHIALRLASGLENQPDFYVSHPIIETHDSHQNYVDFYPAGGTPLFYIQSFKHGQYEVAEKIWRNPEVRSQADLGQSFGFDRTRIVADENVGAVRISGGAYTIGTELGDAIAEALTHKH